VHQIRHTFSAVKFVQGPACTGIDQEDFLPAGKKKVENLQCSSNDLKPLQMQMFILSLDQAAEVELQISLHPNLGE
jgi:hypothetical protein